MKLSYPYLSSGGNFFGLYENGNFVSNENVQLDVAENDDQTYYFFKDFTLNSGHTLTTTRPCKGLYIYVAGTAVVDGVITMVNRGVYSPPEGLYENGYTPLGMKTVLLINGEYADFSLPGKNNLAAGSAYNQNSFDGQNGGCGGGGAGSTPRLGAWGERIGYGGAGGMAGVFGSGSGGSSGWSFLHNDMDAGSGYAASAYSGPGGTGTYWTDRNRSAGRGNNTVCYHTSAMNNPIYIQNEYTSGVLFFICNRLIINDTSVIHFTSPGQKPTQHGHAMAGGPCGGGSVTILYRSTNVIPQANVAAKFAYSSAKLQDSNYTRSDPLTIYSGGNGSTRIHQII